MSTSKVNLLVAASLVIAALLFFVCLGFRDHVHFDEFSYLYGVTHYSISSLCRGEFESSNLAGFFNVKIGHLVLLSLLAKWFGTGLGAIKAIQAVFTILVAATGAMLAMCLWMLWGDWRRALGAGLLFILTPVNIYLAPRLLAEVPGMFCMIASLLFLVMALRCQHRLGFFALAVISALALAYGTLARQNAVLIAAGAWAALWIGCPPGYGRKRIFAGAALVGLLAAGTLALVQTLSDLDPLRGIQLARVVMTQSMSPDTKLKRIMYAFGPVLLIALFAAASRRRRELAFHTIWFGCGLLPIVTGFHFFDLRSVATGAPALAGLASLGCEVVWNRIRTLGSARLAFARVAAGTAAAILLLGGNVHVQPKIDYEVNTSSYSTVINWINIEFAHRPILIPWGHSDYHYLRMAYPELPVYLSNTTAFFAPLTFTKDISQWTAALENWYGDRYIGDMAALERLGDPPWLFLCRQMYSGDSGRFSWVKEEPRLRLTLVYKADRYRLYRVDRRE